MGDNESEFPLDVRVFIFGDVLQHCVISDDFLCLILIDRHSELAPSWVVVQFGLMVFNELNNLSSEYLTIFLFIDKE
jgi:hypothetical protein